MDTLVCQKSVWVLGVNIQTEMWHTQKMWWTNGPEFPAEIYKASDFCTAPINDSFVVFVGGNVFGKAV